jgi:hypothetical protein
LLRDDEEARILMGANGFVEALVQFLQSAVHERNLMAQESGAMALFNLAVNNDRSALSFVVFIILNHYVELHLTWLEIQNGFWYYYLKSRTLHSL